MNKKIAIINVNLEYEFPKETTEEQIKTFLHNVKLPENYISESFDLVKIIEE